MLCRGFVRARPLPDTRPPLVADFPTTPPKPVFEEIAHHCKLQLTPPPTVSPATVNVGLEPSADQSTGGPAQQATPAGGSPYVKMHSPVSIDIKLETGSVTGGFRAAGQANDEPEQEVIDAPLVRAYNLLGGCYFDSSLSAVLQS